MTHTPAPAFAHTSGPHDAKIVIVGEAFGAEEELTGQPFVGYSGQELTRLLVEAGLKRQDILLTNVFAFRPKDNKLEAISGPKGACGPDYTLPPIAKKYILPEFLTELTRLQCEIQSAPRNLVIAMGACASWAMFRAPGIGSVRGSITEATLTPGVKVLPTYHPAGILRNWAWRPIVVADLMKGRREAEFPEIRRPRRQVLVNPTIVEATAWARGPGALAPILSVDIETGQGQIRCIGFAASAQDSMVLPFVDASKPERSYWPDIMQELFAWELVRELLESPVPKLFQNGLYDLQWLVRMGFRPRNCLHDTMLLHHSLFPEMQKSLGFMGSLYTNEAAWKLMRKWKGGEEKADE